MSAIDPLVSVIVPAKDAAATLARALRSVLDQQGVALDVVVVDDGSADATAEVAAGFAGVRLIRLPRSQGAAAARNAGLAAAHGEIVAFQDADDEWRPDKLRRQVDLLRAAPGVVLVACGARLVGLRGEDRGPLYDGQIPRAGAECWRGLLARNTIATPCVVAWRRDCLDAGGFDPALPVGEDQDMWIRLALRGRVAYLDEPLVRVHVTRVSVSGVGSRLGVRQQLQVTLPMIRRHLAARRARLARREIRAILGERLGRIGRAAYSQGLYATGLWLVLRASWLGFRPLENLLFLISAAPPTRWFKRRVLGRARPRLLA